MVSGRPLLYFSLPGVALILGVFWYRRRNKHHENIDTSCKDALSSDRIEALEQEKRQKSICEHETKNKVTPTNSMKINGSVTTDDDNSATKLFGKSAPIKIVQNGNRSSPEKSLKAQNLNSEELKSKIEDAEYKMLRSIDEDLENLSSSVDLPDSVNHRSSFYARNVNCQKDEPVVIKATNTPKISPENSFLESKYTTSVVERNNNNNCAGSESIPKQKTSILGCNKKDMEAQSHVEGEAEEEKRKIEVPSPAPSVCSVQSGDSGKGSSLPRSEATRAKTTYEFLYPISLIGYLYGRQRSFVNKIKAKTNAEVSLKRYPHSTKLRVCVVQGTETEINGALEMIRQRLPAKRYPNFTMQRIHYALPQTVVPLSTHSLLNLQLNLIEGINNDVVVSTVLSGNHIFVQHPLHPTHPSLAVLQKCLYDSYTSAETPLLPCIEISAVCVMPVNGIWYRVQIVEKDSDDELRCIVKFLDFGGYMNAHFNDLRQIRSDFMGLSFQATECILSNIEPLGECWCPDAAEILCKLTRGIVLQAQVAGYNSHNIPEVYLFANLGPNNVIFINKELAARNLAKWVDVRD